LSLIKAVILGVVQGVTEFLPVSSSGHLAVFAGREGASLELIVVLHLGTLLAILVYYRRDVFAAAVGGARLIGASVDHVRGRRRLAEYLLTDAGARLALLIIVGSIPTALIGLGLKGLVDYIVSGHTRIVGAFFIITGLLMYRCDAFALGGKGLGQGTIRDAIMVGIFQGFAVMPGLSRSGLTVFASTMRGFERRDAARFSFLLAVPALLGASLLELKDITGHLPLVPTAAGVAAAFAAGYVSIVILVRALSSRKLRYFTGYLVAMGILVLFFTK